jgi:hypothetical protein
LALPRRRPHDPKSQFALKTWFYGAAGEEKAHQNKKGVEQPTKKLLSDIYDEVLRLRRKILEAQSAKPARVDRHASK